MGQGMFVHGITSSFYTCQYCSLPSRTTMVGELSSGFQAPSFESLHIHKDKLSIYAYRQHSPYNQLERRKFAHPDAYVHF